MRDTLLEALPEAAPPVEDADAAGEAPDAGEAGAAEPAASAETSEKAAPDGAAPVSGGCRAGLRCGTG